MDPSAGRRAIATGASSGIGLALAGELARRGYAVALLARRRELIEDLARSLTTSGAQAVALPCDVSSLESVREAVDRGTLELGGPFDLAVANAGISIPTYARDFRVEDAEQTFRVNVFGMFHLFDDGNSRHARTRPGKLCGRGLDRGTAGSSIIVRLLRK